MKKKTLRIFLLVLLALLLQVVLPAFVSVIENVNESGSGNFSVVDAPHHSVLFPVLLKEKEESEGETEEFCVQLVQILDFSDHTFSLSNYHRIRIVPVKFRDRIDFQPPLFALNSSFII